MFWLGSGGSAVVDRGLSPTAVVLPPRRGSIWCVMLPWVITHGCGSATAMRFNKAKISCQFVFIRDSK